MTWFWLNWLLGGLIVVAYCSIPVWLVLRQRSTAAAPITAASEQRDAA